MSINALSCCGNAKHSESICSKVICSPIAAISKIWNGICSTLAAPLRDRVIFQLNNPAKDGQVAGETQHTNNFWDETAPLDPNFPFQHQIRSHFNLLYDHFDIKLGDRNVTVHYKLIESKFKGSNVYNFVLFPTNSNKMKSNFAAIYPFLASYLSQNPEEAHGRFITVTQYDMETVDANGTAQQYKPENFEQAGLISAEILRALTERYGKIDQFVGQSLGGILFSVGGKHMDEAIMPKNVNLHAAPTSMAQWAKRYFCGCVVNPITKCLGWSFDVGQEVTDLSERMKGNMDFALVISGVKRDLDLKEANFCLSAEATALQNKGSATVQVFDPPGQLAHPAAHHGIKYNWLQSNYVVKGDAQFLHEGENFADGIVRHSLLPIADDQLNEAILI